MSAYLKEKEFCKKWLPLLERIINNEILKNRCKAYNAYISSKENNKLEKELEFSTFLEEGYESGIVIKNYQEVMKEKELIYQPTDEFINSLSELEIIACIAWLFRCDHWDNGFLISEVFVNGTLLKYFQALLK